MRLVRFSLYLVWSESNNNWPDTIDYTGYLSNLTINGLIAEQQNGSAIVLEHRFFGGSNPYNNLSDSRLKVLTIQQAIDDLEYFADNVKLPMPNGDNLAPGKAPWVLVGGSYSGKSSCLMLKISLLRVIYNSCSGALTGWTMVKCVICKILLITTLTYHNYEANPTFSRLPTHHLPSLNL